MKTAVGVETRQAVCSSHFLAYVIALVVLGAVGPVEAQEGPAALFRNASFSRPVFGRSVTGDFDRDGFVDLVILGESVRIYFGNGDGSFDGEIEFLVEDATHYVGVGDVTGDGAVISAEADYSTGVTYLNAGSCSSALASFRSAFLKTQGIR